MREHFPSHSCVNAIDFKQLSHDFMWNGIFEISQHLLILNFILVSKLFYIMFVMIKFHALPVWMLFLQGLSLRIEPFHNFFFRCGHVWNVFHDGLKPIPCKASQYQCKHIFKLIESIYCTFSCLKKTYFLKATEWFLVLYC